MSHRPFTSANISSMNEPNSAFMIPKFPRLLFDMNSVWSPPKILVTWFCFPLPSKIYSIFTVNKCVDVFQSPYEACKNAHSIVIITEWDEFKNIDYEKLYAVMKKPASIFDGRLILDQNKLKQIGFRVFSIGTAKTQSLNLFP